MREKIRIGVIGGNNPSEEILKLAEEVGRIIARKNAILVCGGLGGVMEAACRGAKEAGGVTIGILPTGEKISANPYVDIPIVTGLGEARNIIVVLNSDAIIAIDGLYGTLTEIAYALLYSKPLFGLKTWKLETENFKSHIIYCKNPEEAVTKAITSVKSAL